MSTKGQAEAFCRVMNGTNLFQTVNTNHRPNQIAVMGRVLVPVPEWLQFVKRLKLNEATIVGTDGMLKIVQDYFLKDVQPDPTYPDGKKVVFAWIITVNSTNTGLSLQNIERLTRNEALMPLTATPIAAATAAAAAAAPAVSALPIHRTVRQDSHGKPYVVEEQDVVLPGAPPGSDRNRPNAKGKGARGIGGGP